MATTKATNGAKITIGASTVSIQEPDKEMEFFDGNERLAIIKIIDLILAGDAEIMRLPPGQG